MTEITSNNLNAHYSSQAKVERNENPVAVPPQVLPSTHVYNDIDAGKRLEIINNDIYEGTQSEKGKPVKKFWGKYLGFVAIILGIIGAKKLFK